MRKITYIESSNLDIEFILKLQAFNSSPLLQEKRITLLLSALAGKDKLLQFLDEADFFIFKNPEFFERIMDHSR